MIIRKNIKNTHGLPVERLSLGTAAPCHPLASKEYQPHVTNLHLIRGIIGTRGISISQTGHERWCCLDGMPAANWLKSPRVLSGRDSKAE